MNSVVEGILERPRSHQIAFWTASVVLVIFGFWQFLYCTVAEKYGELEEKKKSLTSQIATERRLAKDLGKFQDRVKELEVRFKYALQELPDKKEIPDLLSSISNLARDAGLEVSLFRPVPEVTRDFYSEVPVSITVQGSFHQVATFFDEVGRLSRIVNINEIGVRNPRTTEDGELEVTADCAATTFRYLDESERQQIESAEGGKKKRRR